MEKDQVVDSLLLAIEDARMRYHRIALLVGIAGSGKTSALQAVHSYSNAPIHNVGVELSRLMLELSEKERSIGLSRLFLDAMASPGADVVLLDRIEFLFHPRLQANPLELLKALGKTTVVVASWPGHTEGPYLAYSKPSHPEHKRYDIGDLVIVETESRQS